MEYQNPTPNLLGIGKGAKIKNQEYISDTYPKYENIYFAFIDALGFRQVFDEHREDETKIFAKRYENVFSYFSKLVNNAKFIGASDRIISGAGQTSDSLFFYTSRPDHLADFIKLYIYFSIYAMSQDVFFRGGIAKGCLFINSPHQFYGDSVIKAFLLEDKIAKVPRVALDKDTYSDLNKIQNLSEEFLYTDSGRYYLTPFVSITAGELSSITNLDPTQIRRVSKNEVLRKIRKGADRFEFDEGTYSKYHFLLQQQQELNKLTGIFE